MAVGTTWEKKSGWFKLGDVLLISEIIHSRERGNAGDDRRSFWVSRKITPSENIYQSYTSRKKTCAGRHLPCLVEGAESEGVWRTHQHHQSTVVTESHNLSPPHTSSPKPYPHKQE